MVRVNVVTFARLKKIIGKKQFSYEATLVKDLISKLIKEFGLELEQELFNDKGEIRKIYRIIVNARNINLLDGLNTKLCEDDMVVLMPAIAGG
ncbi:MAG: MoaD family protein [Candidatus Heimdallarchaeota archaeon]|nr:MoaD family protein [Candidatus Heimdallarchaeota archaeon]